MKLIPYNKTTRNFSENGPKIAFYQTNTLPYGEQYLTVYEFPIFHVFVCLHYVPIFTGYVPIGAPRLEAGFRSIILNEILII